MVVVGLCDFVVAVSVVAEKVEKNKNKNKNFDGSRT